MIVAMKTGRRSAFKALRYVATGVLVVAAPVAARHGWRIYMTSPWTRNGMVRAQVANVAPQMSGRSLRCEHTIISTFTREMCSTSWKSLILRWLWTMPRRQS
jgi:hypothetical protein